MKQLIPMFAFLATGLAATFCLASAGQEVCRPPLVPFDVHRLDSENGYTHSTGGFANDTRVIEVDYIDNRKIVTNLFDSQGEVTLTNTPTQNTIARNVKYRHKVDVPKGDYTITQHATDYEVCAENGEVIFFTEAPIANGASYTIDWIYSVEIVKWGDFNGDGNLDIIIGSEHANSSAGLVMIVDGSGNTIATFNGENTGDAAGRWVSTLGDINGDGADDVIIGAKLADSNGTDSGSTYIILGGPGVTGTNSFASAEVLLTGASAGDETGMNVSGVDDMDGDGISEILIGSFKTGASEQGSVQLIFGNTFQ